nr:uncharacterized protein LOC109757518 [Aegilops tauschii subsp. strangulata]
MESSPTASSRQRRVNLPPWDLAGSPQARARLWPRAPRPLWPVPAPPAAHLPHRSPPPSVDRGAPDFCGRRPWTLVASNLCHAPVPVSNSPRILLKVGSGGDDDEGAEHATADSSAWRRTARAVSHHLLCKQVAAPPGSSRRPCRAPNPPSAASSTMTPSSPASSTRRQGHNRMRTGEIELLLKSGPRRREVAFNMVDCDFKVFEGKWSVQEHGKSLLHGTMAN